MKFLFPAFVVFCLSGCASRPVHHGLSEDGYGFTTNSPHLPPPDHLMTHH